MHAPSLFFALVHCSGWLRKKLLHRAVCFSWEDCLFLFSTDEQTAASAFYCGPTLPLPGISVPTSVPPELAREACFLSVF